MKDFLAFISNNPLLAVFVCIALGYCFGMIKIRSFSFGATIGTLLVGFILSRFVTFTIPGIMETVFSILFCFTIGYEAGPAFFKSLRSNGVKFVIQSVFFCAIAFIFLFVLGIVGILDHNSVIGMAAGALTQSSILTAVETGANASIVYAVTYIFGMVIAILFATVLGPFILRTTPQKAVKEKLSKSKSKAHVQELEHITVSSIRSRAFSVNEGSSNIGATVEEIESKYGCDLQIAKIFRQDKELKFDPSTVIEVNDIVVLISSVENLISIDDEYMAELSDRKYTDIELVNKEIFVTEHYDGALISLLSSYGIVLIKATLRGKALAVTEDTLIQKDMCITVSGVRSSINTVADKIGYVKEAGISTDVPFVFIALAAAIVIGSIKFGSFSFGGSTCALIIGLLCGWYNNRSPKTGKFPESARWFLKSVGLNLFIAVKALTTGAFALDGKMLLLIGIGVAVTLVPHVVTLLFSKYVLKMDNADILGGQCGSGTCTAALNALTDTTGSSAFTTAFATTNAISSILLTLVGVLLAGLII